MLAAALLAGYYAHAYNGCKGVAPHHAPLKAQILTNLCPRWPAWRRHLRQKPQRTPDRTSSATSLIRIISANRPDQFEELPASTGAEMTADTLIGARALSSPHPHQTPFDGAVFVHAAPNMVPSSSSDPEPAPRHQEVRDAGTDNPIGHMLRTEVTPAVAAGVLPTQRLLLPKGAFIDCSLETAIDSSLPGLSTCVTALDTFSADGTVVYLKGAPS